MKPSTNRTFDRPASDAARVARDHVAEEVNAYHRAQGPNGLRRQEAIDPAA